ncbi:MAG: hypothetical protein M1136_06535 [Chloroflexi bacterium]|nr:hypothetical protein [Chloroflexota bacterium]MCL5075288.1 hypothetical protein [Chloroflexota bacterium]
MTCYAVAAKRPNLVYVSGFLLGLTILSKLQGFMVAGVLVGWELFHIIVSDLRAGYGWRGTARLAKTSSAKLAKVAATSMMTIWLLWPVLWSDPLRTFRELLDAAIMSTTVDHGVPIPFLGQLNNDPGPLYYAVTMLIHLTPITLVLSLVGSYVVARRFWHRSWEHSFLLVFFGAAFLVLATMVAHKADRYIMPVYPVTDILGGIGAVALLRHLRLPNLLFSVVLVGLMLAHSVPVIFTHPDYVVYANPLLGGTAGQSWIMHYGYGAGYREAFEYLNSREGIDEKKIWLVYPVFDFATFYSARGKIVSLDSRSAISKQPAEKLPDYIVVDAVTLMRGFVPPDLKEQALDHAVSFGSVPFVWIYRVDNK